MYRNVGGSLDSLADATAVNRQNLDSAVSDDDFLLGFAGQDQHDDTSLIDCVAGGSGSRAMPKQKKPGG